MNRPVVGFPTNAIYADDALIDVQLTRQILHLQVVVRGTIQPQSCGDFDRVGNRFQKFTKGRTLIVSRQQQVKVELSRSQRQLHVRFTVPREDDSLGLSLTVLKIPLKSREFGGMAGQFHLKRNLRNRRSDSFDVDDSIR